MATGDDALAEKLRMIVPHLDERQQRLLLGAEAHAAGWGGVARVARAAGVSQSRVSDGLAEIRSGPEPLGRVRRAGAGRKPLTQTDPELLPALMRLVEPEERGDPMSPLRWTVKSLRTLAGELTKLGHPIGPDTVGELLHAQKFSLQGNAKVVEGQHHPDRDGQFRYINEQVIDHQADDEPVISVDAKKKEFLGERANAGRTWRPGGDPVKVADHDFLTAQAAVAIPYGIYDLTADTGWVNVGTDHNTAAFAVESIRRWWTSTGRHDYPHARRLLITADAGGSNGYRTRTWKAELAELAVQTGLTITVCHFPPGTSKWNKIEHRLFSHIAMNWRGRPLTSHEVVVQSIANTTTRTGLRVHAELDPHTYALGTDIPNAHYQALPLDGHPWHHDWNYTLHPHPYTHLIPAPDTRPLDQPTPDLAWLCDPALTGLSDHEWQALVTLAHNHFRAPGTRGQPPALTIPDQLSAAFLHYRYRLPKAALTKIYPLRYRTLDLHITKIRDFLNHTGHTIAPSPHHLRTLEDLHALAAAKGITRNTPE